MPKQFTDTINNLRRGSLAEELTVKLAELTGRCAETGRAGAITLTLQLKPGKGGQIEVFDDIKIKLPKEERGASIMWPTPEGSLVRDDPKQMTIELRPVATAPAAPLRSIADPATGELREPVKAAS